MEQASSDPIILDLEPDHVRRVTRAPRKLFGFYLLPLSLAGLLFTLFAYGWPWPVAGCALLSGIAIGVLLRR